MKKKKNLLFMDYKVDMSQSCNHKIVPFFNLMNGKILTIVLRFCCVHIRTHCISLTL